MVDLEPAGLLRANVNVVARLLLILLIFRIYWVEDILTQLPVENRSLEVEAPRGRLAVADSNVLAALFQNTLAFFEH